MDAFDPEMFPDTVIVYAPIPGVDIDGGPTMTRGTPTTLAAAVQRVTSTSAESKRQELYQGTIAGEACYNVLFPDDPGILHADVPMDWVANSGGAFATPIALSPQGAAEPPGGLMARWTVSAVRRS